MLLAHLIVSKSLHFFLGTSGHFTVVVDVSGYFSFVTKMMLLFGVGFEFPLLIVMLNFAGMAQRPTAARLVASGDLPDVPVRRGRDAVAGPVRA